MSTLKNLQAASSLGDLAGLINAKSSGLSYTLYVVPDTAKYTTFEIPKRRGGTRIIQAPIDPLKLVQQKLSSLLLDCTDEINVSKKRKDLIAHGFKRDRSIRTNAKEHRNRRYVFTLDLANFFPSINFGRVRGFFIRDHTFALHPKVATVIAKIASHENSLPQGSPCSPVISNLIAHILDMHLVKLASACGCTYSRYADDLTFSTNKKVFPSSVAVALSAGSDLWNPSPKLLELIEHAGFKVNPLKTHMQYRESRQEVTGLVVNRRINTRSEYRRTVRAMVDRFLKTGSFETYVTLKKNGVASKEKVPGTANQLHGMLGFIDSVDLYDAELLSGGKKWEAKTNAGGLSGREAIYRRFLIYINFLAAQMPTVLCEGETDIIYLGQAIKRLAAEFPELATVGADGKVQLKIRLYKYRASSTARLLGLRDGGSSALSKFIGNFRKDTENIFAPGEAHPVVVLFDNDSGATSIKKVVKDVAKAHLSGTVPYFKVLKNLYVQPTPLINGALESKIEDFFEPAVMAVLVGGKSFDPSNNLDPMTHYGKKIFAKTVVLPNAATINFDGFRPLLKNLVALIHTHQTSVNQTSQAQVP